MIGPPDMRVVYQERGNESINGIFSMNDDLDKKVETNKRKRRGWEVEPNRSDE